MSKIRVDYLNFHPDYKVCQHEDMYHFNSDTCLLGEFININKNDNVLDVGTNNGALLVYIIKKGGVATGIEINKDALEMAKLTLKENNIDATLINHDFTTWQDDIKFDVIVCNPPYFNTKDDRKKNVNKNICIARHEDYLPLDLLCYHFTKHLKENGKIFMVHRPNRFDDINKQLNKNNLYIDKYQHVYDKNTNKLRSLLLQISFNKKQYEKMQDKYI